MNIEITEAMRDAVGLKKLEPFGVTDIAFKWNSGAKLDLRDLKNDKVRSLAELLEGHRKIRGVPTLIGDLKLWLQVKDNKQWTKLRNAKFLEPVLREYIGETERKHIYEKVEGDNAYLCYYVSRITYEPPYDNNREQRVPGCVKMECVYEKFDGQHGNIWKWWDGDVTGRTLVELLTGAGLFRETPELRGLYEAQFERYSGLIPKIGRQCLAVGTASNDMDGNPDSRKSSWFWRHVKVFDMVRGGSPTKCVIDIFREEKDDDNDNSVHIDRFFWSHYTMDETEQEVDDSAELIEPQIPVHPYCAIFDLSKHLRLMIHVNNLTEYEFDRKIADKLILPDDQKHLVRMLIEHKDGSFKDIIGGKSGGAVVLLTGIPGVGKTLTAEVYAENEERALYSVQCSQLGTDPNDLEEELLKIFARAKRWNAVMLLDEADVYIRRRATDLQQNAIVGVFLRVLEYQGSVLFLTTNRPEDVDDAIASRCIARLEYAVPSPDRQAKIWEVLSESAGIKVSKKEIAEIVKRNPKLTGRDVKNLLKLGALFAASDGGKLNADRIDFVKSFKPTNEGPV